VLLVFAVTLGCTSLGPSSRSGTEKPGVVDWSCGRYMPTADSPEWTLGYHNELFPGRTTISVRKARTLSSASPHTLNLTGCELQEGVLREIAGLETVKDLCLAGTAGDDAHLQTLSGLNLEALDLSGTAVDDADLAALVKIVTLRNLKLNCTKVSDAGLRSLQSLPTLERLEVSDTAVSEGALEAFRAAKPEVVVVEKYDARVTGGVF